MSLSGKIAERLKRPGLVRPVEVNMPDRLQHFRVRTSERYTIIAVNGMEYFFRREDGKYDGWGGMAVESALSCSCPQPMWPSFRVTAGRHHQENCVEYHEE